MSFGGLAREVGDALNNIDFQNNRARLDVYYRRKDVPAQLFVTSSTAIRGLDQANDLLLLLPASFHVNSNTDSAGNYSYTDPIEKAAPIEIVHHENPQSFRLPASKEHPKGRHNPAYQFSHAQLTVIPTSGAADSMPSYQQFLPYGEQNLDPQHDHRQPPFAGPAMEQARYEQAGGVYPGTELSGSLANMSGKETGADVAQGTPIAPPLSRRPPGYHKRINHRAQIEKAMKKRR